MDPDETNSIFEYETAMAEAIEDLGNEDTDIEENDEDDDKEEDE